MAVYVDAPTRTTKRKGWQYVTACHLWADSSEELDEMAARLGLKPEWKHKPLTPEEHYDLVATMRVRAIACGAREATAREFATCVQHKRKSGRV